MNEPTAEFYFELSANGEQTNFEKVEGVSTEVTLRNNLKEGENPFKFRLPSLPKNRKLVLKNGRTPAGSKLIQWCAGNQSEEENGIPDRSTVVLLLKDAKGKSLLEWKLHRAHPVQSTIKASKSKFAKTEIADLELAFSFFTFSKK